MKLSEDTKGDILAGHSYLSLYLLFIESPDGYEHWIFLALLISRWFLLVWLYPEQSRNDSHTHNKKDEL